MVLNSQEKRKPTYLLKDVHRLVSDGSSVLTRSAVQDAASLGLTKANMTEAVLELTGSDFHVSRYDFKGRDIWHDAYKTTYNGLHLYIKFFVVDNVVVTSFKRDESRRG